MKNFYQVLGVEEDASEKDIKKAYHRLAAEWHPDKHQGKETLNQADEKFKEISEAYASVSSPEKRAEYDKARKGGDFRFHTTGTPFDFEVFFNQQFRARPRDPNPVLPGRDVELFLEIPLAEALFGMEKKVEYAVYSGCTACNSAGANEFQECSDCQGKGHFNRQEQGLFMRATCPKCGGHGRRPTKICETCNGRRVVNDERKLSVKFPAGRHQGQVVRIMGGGGGGMNGGPPGNLFISIRVIYPNLENLSDEEKEQLKNILSKP